VAVAGRRGWSPARSAHHAATGTPRVVWRSSRFVSHRTVLQVVKRDFDVVLAKAPSRVVLETPFTGVALSVCRVYRWCAWLWVYCVVAIEVRSQSDRRLELKLQLLKDRMVSILPCGVSSRVRPHRPPWAPPLPINLLALMHRHAQSLGVFEPRASKIVEVNLLPLGGLLLAWSWWSLSTMVCCVQGWASNASADFGSFPCRASRTWSWTPCIPLRSWVRSDKFACNSAWFLTSWHHSI
jgi:hypothetical protein